MQPPHPPKQAARQTRRYNAVSKSCVSSESPSFFPMLIHRALRKRSHVRPVAHFAGFFLQIGNDVSPRCFIQNANWHSRTNDEFTRIGQPPIEILRGPAKTGSA